MTNTLIPGIYTSYELSGVRYRGRTAGVAGLVWKGSENETAVSVFTGYSQIVSVYGAESSAAKCAKLLFENGASAVKTVQAASGYETGFELLMKETDVTVMLCDSGDGAVHLAMRDAILSGTEDTKYRIGIVGGAGEVNSLSAQAKTINSERMILMPDIECAFALAGLVLGTDDPSLPYNGAVLEGIESDFSYTGDEMNTLLTAGVTPVQTVGGKCEVVRAVTTKTVTAGAKDSTWRDLNTILITDHVIPQIRAALRAMFTRAKNTERTRGAVRTQVVIELERMLDMGIIESYGNVAAVKSESDPAVCEVTFEFAVSGGMHQIIIAAGIIV